MASVTYYNAAGNDAMHTASPVGAPVWETPFEGVNDRLLFRVPYEQKALSYSPLALNTTYNYQGPLANVVPTSTSFYLVAEENFADRGGGVLRWDRVYAAVPSTRYDYTSYVYNYPAVLPTYAIGSYSSPITAYLQGTNRMVLIGVTANPGELVSISYNGSEVGQVNVYGYVRPTVTTWNYGLVVDLNQPYVSATYTRAAARITQTSARYLQGPIVARAVEEFTYALMSPNVTPSFTFNSRQRFLLNTSGEEVQYVSTETTPTAASYLQWISDGTFIYAEDDAWGRWRGNIYVKRSLKVPAL